MLFIHSWRLQREFVCRVRLWLLLPHTAQRMEHSVHGKHQSHCSLWAKWHWTTSTHPGCRNWGRRSQKRNRCDALGLTWCWRCEHSWMPVGKCSRRAGRPSLARWRGPESLSASAPPSPVSIGSTCQQKQGAGTCLGWNRYMMSWTSSLFFDGSVWTPSTVN